jgi:Tfp pilus assembly protein PilX
MEWLLQPDYNGLKNKKPKSLFSILLMHLLMALLTITAMKITIQMDAHVTSI